MVTRLGWSIAYMGNLIRGIVDVVTQAAVVLASVLILGLAGFWAIDPIFSLLNALQHMLQRPYRPLLRKPRRALGRLYLMLFPVRLAIAVVLYVLAFPLRLLNALYYDLYVLSMAVARDALGELLLPKRGRARRLEGLRYLSYWVATFPRRLLTNVGIVLWGLLDGVAMLLVDLFFPTLTMYHGTSFDSAIHITQPGTWVAGPGDFAGRGIYFAMRRAVAEHYASRGVVICARVTLGRNYPLACTPRAVQDAVGRDGDRITDWCLRYHITSIEHWREGGRSGWWEYCLLRRRGDPRKTMWRIRPLYVVRVGKRFPERIWGGKHVWLRDRGAVRVALASAVLAVITWEALLTLASAL
jgi:hypothetical protein